MSVRSVLLISANAKLQRALHTALLRREVQCYASISMQDALQTLGSLQMDAVVFDATLRPRRTAAPLTQLANRFPKVHRVLLTRAPVGRTNTAGADAVLMRPVDMAELLRALGADPPPIHDGIR